MNSDTARRIVLTAVFCATVRFCTGQSLGDVAREQQAKKQQGGTASATHVYTNDDIPQHTETPVTPSKQHSGSETEPAPAHRRSAAEWESQILHQKNAVTTLHLQVEKLRSSIHFVEANLYSNGPQYNERQRQKQRELEQLEDREKEQKKKLDDLREGARKDGYGSSVYGN